MRIIGVTGMLGAGKSHLAKYLAAEYRFVHLSVREFLEKHLVPLKLDPNRDNLVMIADKLRADHSPSYIVEQLYEKAVGLNRDCVIESVRAIAEAQALKSKKDFWLLGVNTPIDIRYERVKERHGSTDFISFEKFKSDEYRENHSNDPHKGNLGKCVEMSDHIFTNDGSIDDFEREIDSYMSQLNKKHPV